MSHLFDDIPFKYLISCPCAPSTFANVSSMFSSILSNKTTFSFLPNSETFYQTPYEHNLFNGVTWLQAPLVEKPWLPTVWKCCPIHELLTQHYEEPQLYSACNCYPVMEPFLDFVVGVVIMPQFLHPHVSWNIKTQ